MRGGHQTVRGVMAKKLTNHELQEILQTRLRLKDPFFQLEKAGSRISGNIVSPSFKGKRDHERQKLIWDALTDELGDEAMKMVGMLLAFTPDEWNLGIENADATPAKTKKAG